MFAKSSVLSFRRKSSKQSRSDPARLSRTTAFASLRPDESFDFFGIVTIKASIRTKLDQYYLMALFCQGFFISHSTGISISLPFRWIPNRLRGV